MRTVEYQKQLLETNGNAAAADVVSPHLTGATVDIVKQGLSKREMGWMRSWLLPLEKAGMIDVEEEFHQSCFHITVYKAYVLPMQEAKSPPREDDSPSQSPQRARPKSIGAGRIGPGNYSATVGQLGCRAGTKRRQFASLSAHRYNLISPLIGVQGYNRGQKHFTPGGSREPAQRSVAFSPANATVRLAAQST